MFKSVHIKLIMPSLCKVASRLKNDLNNVHVNVEISKDEYFANYIIILKG